jgi:hypothetical protein
MASQNGHDAIVKLLLSHSDVAVAVNTQTENGWTALMVASQNGHDAVVKSLLSRSDVAINTQSEDGRTALLAASERGHDAVVKLLLSHSDVAVNTQSENGWTALMLASQNGHDAVVAQLLSHSCSLPRIVTTQSPRCFLHSHRNIIEQACIRQALMQSPLRTNPSVELLEVVLAASVTHGWAHAELSTQMNIEETMRGSQRYTG